jgi:GNAT superfamily N-acetyltransferase
MRDGKSRVIRVTTESWPSVAAFAGPPGKRKAGAKSKLKGGRTAARKMFDPTKHPKDEAGQFKDVPGKGDDAPKGGSPKPASPAPTSGTEKAVVSGFGQSKATVKVHEIVAEEANRIVGKKVSSAQLASAVGAPDDAVVNVTSSGTDGIRLHVQGEGYQAVRFLNKDPDGTIHIKNESFEVDSSKQGRGLGTQVFGRQIENAADLGVSEIRLRAAGQKGGDQNGYYTWPRFGCDGKIPSDVRDELPAKWSDATKISDLMRTAEGRSLWKDHGQSVRVTFDLRPNSLSRRVWEGYLAEKRGDIK